MEHVKDRVSAWGRTAGTHRLEQRHLVARADQETARAEPQLRCEHKPARVRVRWRRRVCEALQDTSREHDGHADRTVRRGARTDGLRVGVGVRVHAVGRQSEQVQQHEFRHLALARAALADYAHTSLATIRCPLRRRLAESKGMRRRLFATLRMSAPHGELEQLRH